MIPRFAGAGHKLSDHQNAEIAVVVIDIILDTMKSDYLMYEFELDIHLKRKDYGKTAGSCQWETFTLDISKPPIQILFKTATD